MAMCNYAVGTRFEVASTDADRVAAQIDEWVDLGVSAAIIADRIRAKAKSEGGAWVDYDENPAWGWANRTV